MNDGKLCRSRRGDIASLWCLLTRQLIIQIVLRTNKPQGKLVYTVHCDLFFLAITLWLVTSLKHIWTEFLQCWTLEHRFAVHIYWLLRKCHSSVTIFIYSCYVSKIDETSYDIFKFQYYLGLVLPLIQD